LGKQEPRAFSAASPKILFLFVKIKYCLAYSAAAAAAAAAYPLEKSICSRFQHRRSSKFGASLFALENITQFSQFNSLYEAKID